MGVQCLEKGTDGMLLPSHVLKCGSWGELGRSEEQKQTRDGLILRWVVVKFEPLTLIQDDLTTHFSRQTVQSLRIPAAIQDIFTKKYNVVLHIAFIFYVFAITSTGIGVLLGGAVLFDMTLPGKADVLGLGNAVSFATFFFPPFNLISPTRDRESRLLLLARSPGDHIVSITTMAE